MITMLIKGRDLNSRQTKEVLSAFVNRHHAIGPGKYYADDRVWLDDHAFHFVKDGSRLSRRVVHCEPYFLAD